MALDDAFAGLFAPKPAGMGIAPQIVQGTIIEFNPATGANTVSVMGAQLTNMLIIIGNTYSLLGRVVTPGNPGFGSASAAFAASGNEVGPFAVGTAGAVLVNTSIAVPSWANRALITFTAMANTHGGSSAQVVGIQSYLNGEDAGSIDYFNTANQTCEGVHTGQITWNITTETQFTYGVALLAGTAIATNTSNYLQANISATFLRA
jgi:hypothetical protein